MDANSRAKRAALIIGALGVVYGDIGTSPLYALRECFTGSHGIKTAPQEVVGVVSLVCWTLTLIVSVKYLALVMRANNRGEGGILSLLSITLREEERRTRHYRRILLLGVFGAALLYGDGIITPAVTVLSAVEGLEVATPLVRPYVMPIAIVILLGLFSFQRHGTHRVGNIFGPVMVLWFPTLSVLGVRGITLSPQIFEALNPAAGAAFLLKHGHEAFSVMGAVFLSVTGAEALYADMGHFGATPIRRAWYGLVFPALLLNYLGEGALLLVNPEAARNPFYLLAPSWALLPLVGLATAAAVIASQALISGAYSLSMQAVQMGLLPRLHIRHTSRSTRGQIFMPQVNGFLMVSCIGLVIVFESSSKLAGAYGIAVSLTMLITTFLFYAAARKLWGWHPLLAGAVCGVFIIVELTFAGANLLKLFQGGWFPLAVGVAIFAMMTTWKRGREALRVKLAESYLPFDDFLTDAASHKVLRVPGTAVFLSGNPGGTPIALLHNLRHNKVLHERIIVLTIITEDQPSVRQAQRIQVEKLRPDVYRVMARYGFMEQPNVPLLLDSCAPLGVECNPAQMTYFVSRETIIPKVGPGMARWRRALFATMSRNAQPVTAFFQLTPNRVVELGMQVEV